MASHQPIRQELHEIGSMLAQQPIASPYQVPPGYFDGLPERILLRIKAEQAYSPKEELELLSPLLGSIGKRTPFTVPAGYFDNLQPQTGAAPSESAKVIRPFFSKKILRYAAAAAMAGIIAASAWFFNDKTGDRPAPQAMTKVNEPAAENPLASVQLQSFSDTEMSAFLESREFVPAYATSPVSADIKDEDMNLMLANISDKELENYLSQTGASKPIIN